MRELHLDDLKRAIEECPAYREWWLWPRGFGRIYWFACPHLDGSPVLAVVL